MRLLEQRTLLSSLSFQASVISQQGVNVHFATYVLVLVSFFFFYFLTSLLEYNCFTMVCQFLLYNKVNQLYIYIQPHISSLLRLPPIILSHPPRQSQSTKLLSLCYAAASHQLSILQLVLYICPRHPLASSQLPLPLPHVLKSILYVCIFIPVLPLGSSEHFFFQIPYICVSIQYLFFSF